MSEKKLTGAKVPEKGAEKGKSTEEKMEAGKVENRAGQEEGQAVLQ